MDTVIKSASLFFCEGGSDKEYGLQLMQNSSGTYYVICQWGRRGSTLQSGMKCTGQPLDKATKVYDKLYDEKVGKGYKEGAAGTSYTPAPVVAAVVDTGERFVPQLLNPIEDEELERYLRDDSYGMQEKKDGHHVTLVSRSSVGLSSLYNKKGKQIGCPAIWGQDSGSCVLDGEAIGDALHVFDLLEIGGQDFRGKTYVERWHKLSQMTFGASIKIVPLAIGYDAKKKMYDQMVAGKKEGVVFKRLASLYTPGRPASGGDMLKFKFVSTCSVRVKKGRVDKRSIGMEILNGDKWEFIGNCTIPPNKEVPVSGVAEIRYLYAYKGGSLYQPFYIGLRDDVDEDECLISQIKYKAEED